MRVKSNILQSLKHNARADLNYLKFPKKQMSVRRQCSLLRLSSHLMLGFHKVIMIAAIGEKCVPRSQRSYGKALVCFCSDVAPAIAANFYLGNHGDSSDQTLANSQIALFQWICKLYRSSNFSFCSDH